MNKEYSEIFRYALRINGIYFRHDIDGPEDLSGCRELLNTYKAHDIHHAVFCFLPFISNRWNGIDTIMDRVRREHDLAIHIDAGQFMPSGDGLYEYITKGTKELKTTTLLCSGHGSPQNHTYGYSYEIWNSYNPDKNVGLGYQGKKYSLHKLGFIQDLSMLPPECGYLGDSMGKWLYYFPNMGTPVPYEGNLPITEDPVGVILECLKQNIPLQMLIHPRYSL